MAVLVNLIEQEKSKRETARIRAMETNAGKEETRGAPVKNIPFPPFDGQ